MIFLFHKFFNISLPWRSSDLNINIFLLVRQKVFLRKTPWLKNWHPSSENGERCGNKCIWYVKCCSGKWFAEMWTVLQCQLSFTSQSVAAGSQQYCCCNQTVAPSSQQLLLAANSCCLQPTVAACSQQLVLAVSSICFQPTVAAGSQQLMQEPGSCCCQPTVAAVSQQLLLSANSYCCSQQSLLTANGCCCKMIETLMMMKSNNWILAEKGGGPFSRGTQSYAGVNGLAKANPG